MEYFTSMHILVGSIVICLVWNQLPNMFWDAKMSLLGGKHLTIAMFLLHNLFWWLIYLDMFVLKHAALTRRIRINCKQLR